MKLKNTPWKTIYDEDRITILDSKDFSVADLELDVDFLPGTVADEEAKARAITRLPELLEGIGSMISAEKIGEIGAFNDAQEALFSAYKEILEPK